MLSPSDVYLNHLKLDESTVHTDHRLETNIDSNLIFDLMVEYPLFQSNQSFGFLPNFDKISITKVHLGGLGNNSLRRC